jgi:hypothetical protein
MPTIRHALSVVFGALGCGLSGTVLAQEYCVSCSGPDGLYRCVIDDARPGSTQSLQMLCVTAMAREGGHASCRITRGTVFQCDAPVKRVSRPGPAASADAKAPPGRGAYPPAVPDRPPSDKPATTADEPPKTVVDLAKRANEQTIEQMRKTNENVKDTAKSMGDAIGSATKKTWDCVSSFFTRCWQQ